MVRIAGRLLLAVPETAGGRTTAYRDMGAEAFAVSEKSPQSALHQPIDKRQIKQPPCYH